MLGGSEGEIYTVFDEESESAVRIDEFLHPEEKLKENDIRKINFLPPLFSY